MDKEARVYLTLKDKIDELVEYIYQGVMEDFDMKYAEDELEEMDANDQ